jgi:hypothetical protein
MHSFLSHICHSPCIISFAFSATFYFHPFFSDRRYEGNPRFCQVLFPYMNC